MPVGLLVELGLLLLLGFLPRPKFLLNVRHLLRPGEPGSHLSAIPVPPGTPSASRTPTATRTPSPSRTPTATRTPSPSRTKVAKNHPTRFLHILMHQMRKKPYYRK